MATIPEDITSQIDGITSLFTTLNDISNGILANSNGITINSGDLTVTGSNSFTLAFTPEVGDTLQIFINPVLFNITSQVDGITRVFEKGALDTLQGDFVAILNGIVVLQETETIDSDFFRLSFIPEIGDELEYFRVIDKQTVITTIPLDGSIKITKLSGTIQSNNLNGSLRTIKIQGAMTQNELNGKMKTTKLAGELN